MMTAMSTPRSIYAMSGGNPATLEYLIARRRRTAISTTRVTDVLAQVPERQGPARRKDTAVDTAKEYRDKKIGPYLALVGGNVMVARSPHRSAQAL